MQYFGHRKPSDAATHFSCRATRMKRNQALLAQFRKAMADDNVNARRAAFEAALAGDNTLLKQMAITAGIKSDDPALRAMAIRLGLSSLDQTVRQAALEAALASKDPVLQHLALAEIFSSRKMFTGFIVTGTDPLEKHPLTVKVSKFNHASGELVAEVIGMNDCDHPPLAGALTGTNAAISSAAGCTLRVTLSDRGAMTGTYVDDDEDSYKVQLSIPN